ncbi:hypothetical protein CI109_102522 [Kwoniella shandongensis]|uniref:Uncharacterized protein n=1 Tax=Kwoniella shandongensis TaxID=1734106 RepID=A0A5M6BXV5_9TREE|nr:uncharacterized protein CI109_005863 [Kwoniella shandongensis]KAA5525839.1 hypothetical protein CI109_005863 [Kwoniella shandongensis]
MQKPSPIWIGYNVFRLVSLVFLIWALIAQFTAIANDMSAYSDDTSTSTSASTSVNSNAQSKSASTATSSSSPSTTQVTINKATGIVNWGGSASIVSNAPATASATSLITSSSSPGESKGSLLPVNNAAGLEDDDEDQTDNVEVTKLAEDDGQLLVKKAASSSSGSSEGDVLGEANWGLSSIPRQTGGVAFTVISRLIMAFTLALLVLGQLGWPEMFLYKWIPWLGPQSTPLWLGLVQLIVAIENLRVYAKSSLLIPAWGLLAVGLVNLIFGSALLYLARKLPKNPPPPLYFNLSTRVLYLRSPPQCYDQLFNKDGNDSADEGRVLPPSNANEIGLDDEEILDEEKYIEADDPASQARPTRLAQRTRADHSDVGMSRTYQDVSQGGYPTFSGGRLTDPGRHVPAGFLETSKSGRGMEFVVEGGHRNAGLGDLPPLPALRDDKSKTAQRRDDQLSRNHSRRSMDASQAEQSRQQVASPRRAEILDKHGVIRNGKGVAVESAQARTEKRTEMAGTSKEKRKMREKDGKQTSSSRDVGRRPPPLPENKGVIPDPHRQSSLSGISAANDLTPKFPLPPSHRPIDDPQPDQGVKTMNISGRASSTTPPLKVESKRSKSNAIDAPKTPKSARSRTRTEEVSVPSDTTRREQNISYSQYPSQTDLLSPTPSSASTVRPPRRANTLDPHLSHSATASKQVPPLTTSMAKSEYRLRRSNSARSTRTARSVRFDSKVEAQSPPGYDSPDEGHMIESPPVPGIRIPGTNMRVAIPSIGLGTPRTAKMQRPESTDSTSSSETGSASETELVPERGVKRTDRSAGGMADKPRSMAVLGGTYLDGGKETDRRRRRSSTSIDPSDLR